MSYGEEEDSCSRGSYGEDDEKVSSKEKLKEFISTLPRGKCWITKHLYYYQGFWYWDERLSEVISAQDASRYESYDPLISSRALVQNLAPHGLRPLCSLSWTESDIIMIPTPCIPFLEADASKNCTSLNQDLPWICNTHKWF